MIAIALLSLYLNSPVHDESRYLDGYVQGAPITIEVINIGGLDKDGNNLVLERRAAEALLEMRSDMMAASLELRLNYAYRTMAQQVSLYKMNRRLAGQPGLSTHQEGRAIDVSGCTKRIGKRRYTTPVCTWLRRHAVTYGFSRTILKEPWHWEFTERHKESIVRADSDRNDTTH